MDVNMLAQVAEETRRVPTDAELRSIAALAKKQQHIEIDIVTVENNLKTLKKDLAQVAEVDLPAAMELLGMTDFGLDNGYRVVVEQEYYANIPSADAKTDELLARRAAAFKWLRDNGHESLIKCQIVVETGKGEAATAALAIEALGDAGIEYSNTESVHSSTLKAFVREQMEASAEGGEEVVAFPETTFGVHAPRVATIKKPKAKK